MFKEYASFFQSYLFQKKKVTDHDRITHVGGFWAFKVWHTHSIIIKYVIILHHIDKMTESFYKQRHL